MPPSSPVSDSSALPGAAAPLAAGECAAPESMTALLAGLATRTAVISVPLGASEEELRLNDAGERMVFDLVESIPDMDLRDATTGRLLRALWTSPDSVVAQFAEAQPVYADRLRPLAQLVAGPGDSRLRWLGEVLRRAEVPPVVWVETVAAAAGLRRRFGDVQICADGDEPGDAPWAVFYDLPWSAEVLSRRLSAATRAVVVPHWARGWEAAIRKVLVDGAQAIARRGQIEAAGQLCEDLIDHVREGVDGAAWMELYGEVAVEPESSAAFVGWGEEARFDWYFPLGRISTDGAGRCIELGLPLAVEAPMEGHPGPRWIAQVRRSFEAASSAARRQLGVTAGTVAPMAVVARVPRTDWSD